MIKVYSSRSVHPNIITISNQYENKTRYLDFDLSEVPEGNRYLIVTYEKTSYAFPIGEDGTFEVTSSLTWEPAKTYYANIVVSDIPIVDKLESSNALFVSDTIKLIVNKNYINAESLSEQPFPKELQIVYDDLLNLKKEIEQKLENGEFDGKDGVGIKSIEKTGSEGLIDTYTITLTDDSTFVYTVTNGEDGINGKSAYELAVENGFEGTEEEWLESLRYDHSEEFKQLAEQVKQDAQSSAENASKAEQAMTQANQTAQANLEAIQSASQTAQSDISTAKQDAVNAVEQAQKDAEQSIATKHSEAVQAVEQAQSTAETAINAKQAESVNAVETAKEEATKAIETGKTEAVEAITTAKDEAIEEIENTGVPLEDIEKLAIKETAQGNPTIINDSADWRLHKLNVYGQSEQDSTTGKNLLNPTGATKVGWNIELPNFRLEVGKQYTYTEPILEGSKACGLYAKASDTQLVPYLQSRKTQTFTVAEEADFSQGILLAGGDEDALTLGDELTAMVELGSVATEFEPYTGGKPSPSPDYPQEILSKEVSEIKVTGANLFDFVTLAGGEGATFEKNGLSARIENGYLITTGTAINDAFTNILFVSVPMGKRTIFPAGTYRLGKGDKGVTNLTIGITTVSGKTLSNYGLVFTLDEPFYFTWFYIAYALGQNANGEKCPLIMTYGSDPLYEYEPYIEPQVVNLTSPITLRGIPVSSGGNVTIDGQQYVSDVITEKDGVIGVERNTIPFSLLVKDMNNNDDYPGWKPIEVVDKIIPPNVNDTQITNTLCNIISRTIYARRDTKTLYFVAEELGKTQTEFKEQYPDLSVNFIAINYQPTFEPLHEEIQTQYKALKSYYPNTVIQSGAFNEVTFVADTKMYIDKKLSEISSQLIELKADTLLLGGM